MSNHKGNERLAKNLVEKNELKMSTDLIENLFD